MTSGKNGYNPVLWKPLVIILRRSIESIAFWRRGVKSAFRNVLILWTPILKMFVPSCSWRSKQSDVEWLKSEHWDKEQSIRYYTLYRNLRLEVLNENSVHQRTGWQAFLCCFLLATKTLLIYSKNVSPVIQPFTDFPILPFVGTLLEMRYGIRSYLKIIIGDANISIALIVNNTVKHYFASFCTKLYTALFPLFTRIHSPFGHKKNADSSRLNILHPLIFVRPTFSKWIFTSWNHSRRFPSFTEDRLLHKFWATRRAISGWRWRKPSYQSWCKYTGVVFPWTRSRLK